MITKTQASFGNKLGLLNKKTEHWLLREARRTIKFSYFDYKLFQMPIFGYYRKTHKHV